MLGSGGGGDRGRLRHLLRSSVAGLCELKLLRNRQEVRVRRALQGGEAPPWSLEVPVSSLPGYPLPQLMVQGEAPGPLLTIGSSSEEEVLSPPAGKLLTDLDRQLWELERQLGELRLRAENDNENVECEVDGVEASDVFVERSSRGGLTEARMHYANERPKSAGDIVVGSHAPRSSTSRLLVPRSLSAPYPSPSSSPPPPPLSRRAEGYILSLLRRQLRPSYLRSASAERPPPPPPASGCRMANVSYTPPHRVPRRKHPPLLKGHSVEGSPPRLPRKCLSAEEPPRKRGGRRTPRSLSETSLRDPSHHGEEWNEPKGHTEGGEAPRGNVEGWVHPRVRAELWGESRSQTEGWAEPRALVQDWGEHRSYSQEGGRCYTLGREGRAPPVKIGPPCRKWRSTAEISGGGPEEESRVDSEGEEEEGGELVWPLQLPPRDADGRPQMFKVKASQALKKKIMRFHTGSLKVMTTV